MSLRKYNINKNAELVRRLHEQGPVVKSAASQYPGWKPKEKWTGAYAKYETLLTKFGAKPFPLPFGEQAAYELLVSNDYVRFYDDGEAYSTNTGKEMGYGVLSKYPGALVLFDQKGKTAETDPIAGYITRANGKNTWNVPAEGEGKPAETSNPALDGLQLALDFVGLVPGIGDVVDIINAGISFIRGNYVEGFISLIGAIPVVGSVLSIPLKLVFKGFSRAGDVLKAAWLSGKSATEVWRMIKASGKLTPVQLDMLVKGMGDISGYLTKFRKEAGFVLPDAAAKSLDEFSAFIRRNADDAAEVFSKAGTKAKGILKVRKELDTINGIQRIFGGRMARRMLNLFNTALSPKELKALQSAMMEKFFKNMDNPGKLTALLKTTPDLEKRAIAGIQSDAIEFLRELPTKRRQLFQQGWNTASSATSASKRLESQLAFLKTAAPDVYAKAYANITDGAIKGNNPMYRQFMDNEINGLGSYFSKDYTAAAGLEGATSRWSNLAPIVFNEISDMGEDVQMAAGIETEDDVNGLFWPLLKSTLSAAEPIPYVGDFIKWGESGTKSALKAAGETPLIGAALGKATGAANRQTYDPTTQFKIVPTDSPELQKQQKAKEKRIQQQKRFF